MERFTADDERSSNVRLEIMSPPYVRAIALTVWIIWLGSLHGKKLFPAVFGSSALQWTCAVIVAVLIPIGTLLALRQFSCPDQRRSGLGLLMACVFPLLVNLITYGIAGPLMARTAVSLSAVNDRDTEMIATLTRQAVEAETFIQRGRAASALHSLYGIRSAWRDRSGTLTIYTPSEEDEASRRRSTETNHRLTESSALLDSQLKQFPWLFALNLGCFTFIFLAGMAWKTYKRSASPSP